MYLFVTRGDISNGYLKVGFRTILSHLGGGGGAHHSTFLASLLVFHLE